MPCGLCELTFNSKPCEHPTGILTREEALIVNFSTLKFRNSYADYVMAYHKTLHSKCPCISCLVKMICYKDYSIEMVECEEYSILMDKLNPLFMVCYNQTLDYEYRLAYKGVKGDKKEL